MYTQFIGMGGPHFRRGEEGVFAPSPTCLGNQCHLFHCPPPQVLAPYTLKSSILPVAYIVDSALHGMIYFKSSKWYLIEKAYN